VEAWRNKLLTKLSSTCQTPPQVTLGSKDEFPLKTRKKCSFSYHQYEGIKRKLDGQGLGQTGS
jgi:hypothetical protein